MRRKKILPLICGFAFTRLQCGAIEVNGGNVQDLKESIGCGQTISGDTNSQSPEHIYSFTLSRRANITLDACDSDFDTVLTLNDYKGVTLQESDDACRVASKIEQYTLEPGKYFSMIRGFSNSFGRYSFTLSCVLLESNMPSFQPSMRPSITFSATPSVQPSTSLNPSSQPSKLNFPKQGVEGAISCGEAVSGDTREGENHYNNPSPEHFYKFSLKEKDKIRFNLCGSLFDTIVRIYDARTYEQVAFNDDSSECGQQSILTMTLPAGDYFVMIEGYRSRKGPYEMKMICNVPPVEVMTKETVACGQSLEGTTSNAGDRLANPSPDHIFDFSISAPTNVIFDACASNFDTFLAVYDEDITRLIFNDDFDSCGLQSKLSIVLGPGKYFLLVEGFQNASGRYNVTMSCTRVTVSPRPSLIHSTEPSTHPSLNLSMKPSMKPSTRPSEVLTLNPSMKPSVNPSTRPSKVLSLNPSTRPSEVLSLNPSMKPSMKPSSVPSELLSFNPSATPSVSPSNSGAPSLSPSILCVDSPMKFLFEYQDNDKLRFCSWLRLEENQAFCLNKGVARSCPVTCSSCDSFQCADSPYKFRIKWRNTQQLKDCRWVRSDPGMRCKKPGVSESCRNTCKFCEKSETPSMAPSSKFSVIPTVSPSEVLSTFPSLAPSTALSSNPSKASSTKPSALPSAPPSLIPTNKPSSLPSPKPSGLPTAAPSMIPTNMPSSFPSSKPSGVPTDVPSSLPSSMPSRVPTAVPSSLPSSMPSRVPTALPSRLSSSEPSRNPTAAPSMNPTTYPSSLPSSKPTEVPSSFFSSRPSNHISSSPSESHTSTPSSSPTVLSSSNPSYIPSIEPSSSCDDPKSNRNSRIEYFKMRNVDSDEFVQKSCDWVQKWPHQCNALGTALTCPGTCGTCKRCEDSPYQFMLKNHKNEWILATCSEYVAEDLNRCILSDLSTVCRKTCGCVA